MLAHKLRRVRTSGPLTYVGGYATSWLGQTTDKVVSLTSLTGGTDSAPQAGDIVIAAFARANQYNLAALLISGYTEIAQDTSGDSEGELALLVAYKFMGGSPDTTITLPTTNSTAAAGAVCISVWRNANPTTPLDVAAASASGANSAIPNPPTITPATAGCVIFACGGAGHIRGTATFSSSDLTNFLTVGGNDTNDISLGLGTKTNWTSGAFDPAAFTFSASNSTAYAWTAITFVLRTA
ncbi:MAG: hypothetical protein AB7O95_01870 [Geminicoccaceae bacterium]